jgi:hypothetical protein
VHIHIYILILIYMHTHTCTSGGRCVGSDAGPQETEQEEGFAGRTEERISHQKQVREKERREEKRREEAD